MRLIDSTDLNRPSSRIVNNLLVSLLLISTCIVTPTLFNFLSEILREEDTKQYRQKLLRCRKKARTADANIVTSEISVVLLLLINVGHRQSNPNFMNKYQIIQALPSKIVLSSCAHPFERYFDQKISLHVPCLAVLSPTVN